MDRLENILRKAGMERSYERLTQRERNIISLYYLAGYKDEEIASYYKVTRENICKLRKNGLNKLKKMKKLTYYEKGKIVECSRPVFMPT